MVKGSGIAPQMGYLDFHSKVNANLEKDKAPYGNIRPDSRKKLIFFKTQPIVLLL